MTDEPVPPKYEATVGETVVYRGDDLVVAMATFEAVVDLTATRAGSEMVFYVSATPMDLVIAYGMVAGQRELGKLVGVKQGQWQSRQRLPPPPAWVPPWVPPPAGDEGTKH